MDEGTLPNWLTEEDDGSITISFEGMRKLPSLDGTEVSTLRMREPTLADQLGPQKAHKDMADAEVAIIANLMEVSPDNVKGLTMKQYARCQAAFAFFQAD